MVKYKNHHERRKALNEKPVVKEIAEIEEEALEDGIEEQKSVAEVIEEALEDGVISDEEQAEINKAVAYAEDNSEDEIEEQEAES